MDKTIKRLPYGRHWVDSSDIQSVIKVLNSDWLTQGPLVQELEAALCRRTGARYAVMVSNGTAALHIAALAAGLSPKDEAITSPITFVATSNSILYCGAKPIFVDIDPKTINMDPAKLCAAINKKTKAIFPVHFSGLPCDMKNIRKIAKQKSLLVIEDGAHALGAKYNGYEIGSCQYSDMTTLSFHPVKHITTGEGGAVLTNNETLYNRLIQLRNHGITKDPNKMLNPAEGPWSYEQQMLGYNYRISDFQCALGLSQLKKLNRFISRRRQIAQAYNRAFGTHPNLVVPIEHDNARSSWHIYPIRLTAPLKRKLIVEKLNAQGIGTQVHYIPVYRQPYYVDRFGQQKNKFPHAESYYESAITLPLFPKMTDHDVKNVINALLTAIK